MFYAYVLRSLKTGKRYIGSTGRPPEERLHDHNTGKSWFTKFHKPFMLVHVEPFLTRTEARKRENFLKSGQGRKWFDSHIQE